MRRLAICLATTVLALSLSAESLQPGSADAAPVLSAVEPAAMPRGLALAPGGTTAPAAWSPIPALDSLAPGRFDGGLDKLSTGLALAAMALPAAGAIGMPAASLGPAGLAYSGSLVLTYGAMELLKRAFPRPRPYASAMDGLDADVVAEAYESFPSRHTALAFCAATALTVITGRVSASSAARPWIIAGSFALAAGTAVLRVGSGAHFPSDVLVGAAIGAGIGGLCGLLVPVGSLP